MTIFGNLDPRQPDGDIIRARQRPPYQISADERQEGQVARDQAVAEVPLENTGSQKKAPGPAQVDFQKGSTGGRASYVEPPEAAREPGGPRRRNGVFGFALVGLLVGFVAAAGYAYLASRGRVVSLQQISDKLHSIEGMGARLAAQEDRVKDLAGSLNHLGERLAALDHKADLAVQSARRQTQQTLAQAEKRWQEEMDRRQQATNARLNQIEQNQAADHNRLAQLNNQLDQEVASLRSELAATQEGANRGLASVRNQVSQNQDGLQHLTQQLHRDRLTFEASKNSPTELAPGVSLTVLKTNVPYQRFRGYITLTAEGRTVWLDNLGANKSLDLYSQDSAHPYSLVITRVSPRGVTGYLLKPAGV